MPAADPAARIQRLQQAIGTGHADYINPFDVLVCILTALHDQPALRLLYAQRKAA